MNESQPNNLDDLLRDWSDQNARDSEQLTELQQRILDRWDAGEELSPTAPTIHRENAPRRSGFAVGIAVGTLVTAAVAFLWTNDSSQLTNSDVAASRNQPPPKFAWLSDAQLTEKTILRDEMIGLFDRQFGWFAETSQRTEIGIEEIPRSTGARVAAVRVIVERRASGGDWDTVWAVDVVTRSEQRIELIPDADELSGFRLWAYVLPDGMVSVDTGLTFRGAAPISAESLQRDGKPEVIYSASADGHELRILQAAAALEG